MVSKKKDEVSLSTCMVPVEKYKKMPKNDLKKFWRGYIASIKWMKDPKNEKELRKIISEKFKDNPELTYFYSSKEKLEEYWKMIKFFEPNEFKTYNTVVLKKLFEVVKTIRNDLGNKPTELKYSDLVDISALEEVMKEMNAW